MPGKRYPNGDPRLKTRSYKAIVAYWNQIRPTRCEAPHCLLRGKPITYGPTRTSTSLDVGHKQPRQQDTRQTWAIEDTRPEHQHCNRSAGRAISAAPAVARAARPHLTGPEQSATPDAW